LARAAIATTAVVNVSGALINIVDGPPLRGAFGVIGGVAGS
jgi:hypothetical protein